MAVEMNSFHITDVVYDSENRELTYKFVHNGMDSKRVSLGLTTDEEIAEDFQRTINKYYKKQ